MIYTYDNLMLNGRLGNQLWQIAATINFAVENNGIALFNPNWEYRQFFSVPDVYFGEVVPGSEVVDGGTEYFQEYHYFETIDGLIRKYFQPSDTARDVVWGRWFNGAGKDVVAKDCCAVHVRRGDYLKYPKHFPISTAKYYNSAVEQVKSEADGELCFLVFSDDIEWCRNHPEHFGFGDSEVVFVDGVVRPVEVSDRKGEPQDWIDLFMMTMCDHHIISNSTFAWWGAFLSGNKRPIYPSQWFGAAVPNWKNWEKAMLPGWRRFSC